MPWLLTVTYTTELRGGGLIGPGPTYTENVVSDLDPGEWLVWARDLIKKSEPIDALKGWHCSEVTLLFACEIPAHVAEALEE